MGLARWCTRDAAGGTVLVMRDNAFVAYWLRMTPAEEAYLAARSDAAKEGRKLYGEEGSDAWLAALEDGTHPLCRLSEPTRR